ncbi:MAG: hypothetical protein M5U26_11920 [Planctomycetota bacterium]|nr:hypothetical protein [Planctomycetota bacterium]
MAIFAACRMRTFARLISDELGVRVKLKGKQILARDGRPPVIFLPAMEYASEEAVQAVRGFALHEAGHVKWSDFRVCREMRSFPEKELHNAIEDEWIEHKLERIFPGGREMLVAAHREGLELVHGQPEGIPERSWFAPEAKPEIIERFKANMKPEYLRVNPGATEADAEKAAQEAAEKLPDEAVAGVAARLELRRAALCWLYRKRGYDKWVDLREWDSHPWRKIFEEETTVRARDSWQALEQARRILERLGIQDALPGDRRPLEELRELAEKAKATKEAAKEARRKLGNAKAELREAVRKGMEGSPEQAALRAARRAHERAERATRRLTERAERATRRTDAARERLDRATARLEDLRKRLEACPDADQADRLRERVANAEGVAERQQSRFAERCRQAESASFEASKGHETLAEAKDRLAEAEGAHSALRKALWEKSQSERAEELERLEAEHKDAKASADAAKSEWQRLAGEVRAREEAIAAPIQPGVREEIVRRAWDRHRSRPVEEDLESLNPEDVLPEMETPDLPDFSGPARAYAVADRSLDRVEKVTATPQANADHRKALREHAKLIERLIASLRRLHSPIKSRVRVNVERGRLDAKRLFRVGMALRGAPVDARRVWKTVVTKPDPKVAVSVLLDCSGSMTQMSHGGRSRYQVAIGAAAALAAALRELGIPHEILGHTTRLAARGKDAEKPDLENFSRFAPFQGYVLKGFGEDADASAVFSQFEMHENLDSEAVLWAAKRLEARPEKTRILVVISDGLPSASDSNTGELERHLLTVCRTLEAREVDGVHLCGIGIGEERVKAFYRNAEVIQDVEVLPGALVGVVERVLVVGGRCGKGYHHPNAFQTYLPLIDHGRQFLCLVPPSL